MLRKINVIRWSDPVERPGDDLPPGQGYDDRIEAENGRPFSFLVCETGDIVFAAIKSRDTQWKILRIIRDADGDFMVSSWLNQAHGTVTRFGNPE